MDNLEKLAELIKKRNALERELTAIIGRPAELGHLGEYIASQIFNIKLEEAATHKGSDGNFTDGILKGKSVNIKWYARREGLIDVDLTGLPDYYLVLSGPKSAAVSSRGQTRPWLIDNVYLFDAHILAEKLKQFGVKISIATSVRQSLWIDAEIYPLHTNSLLPLSEMQHRALELFGSARV